MISNCTKDGCIAVLLLTQRNMRMLLLQLLPPSSAEVAGRTLEVDPVVGNSHPVVLRMLAVEPAAEEAVV